MMKKLFYKQKEILIICALFLFVGLLTLNQMFLYTPDSARYLIWANSLANGEGFKDATTPEPTRYVLHAPLYPILLAPSAVFFHNNVIAAKVSTLLLGCLALFMFYLFLCQRVEKVYAILGSVILALNPLMLMFSTQILSDVPFVLILILFLFLSKTILEKRKGGKHNYLFIAVIVVGIFLREIGLSLMLAAVVYFLWTKQYRRTAMIASVSLFFYLLWFFRNEILVGNIENPSLRNLQLYFTHIYTSSQTNILEELLVRLWSNVIVYSNYLSKSLFMPGFALTSNKLISIYNPFIALVLLVIPYLQYLLIGVSLGLAVIGVRHEFKNSKTFLFIIIFVICYFGLMLFYPLIEFRYLFPLMFVMLYFFIIGIKQTFKWLRKIMGSYKAHAAVASLVFIFLIPNLSWVQNYVLNSWQFGHSSENSYCDPKNPEMFTNPLHLAAKWIVQHTDSSAIVFSYWKELAIWLDGRKVIVGRSLIPPDQFDCQLRDYGVKYVVAVHWQATLNECEPLFVKSKKFEFVLVHKVGNVQIFEVRRKGELFGKKANINLAYQKVIPAGLSYIDSSYTKALHLLEDDPAKAEPAFIDLASQTKNSTVMEYYLGVTKEFLGQVDSANMIFEKYSSFMQAGIFARMAWQHQEIIWQLKNASYNNNPYERVMIFHMLAKDYWNLGFRKQSIKMLDRALEIDSMYRPVIESYAVYAFQQGDTILAENYLKKCQKIEPYNIFASNFISTVQYIHALQNTVNPAKQRELRLKIAESYISAGLLENAIDELQTLLYSNRSDITAMRLLGELYEIKSLYEPALRCFKTLLILDPMDREAERKISILSTRF